MLGAKIPRDMQGLAGLRGRIQMLSESKSVLLIKWSEAMRGSVEAGGCMSER